MAVLSDSQREPYFLTSFDRTFREYVRSEDGDFMRFADDMVVCGATLNDCERFVFEASSRLHELGLNVNVAKVRYCNKSDFQRFWGFVVMDRFESGDIIDGLLRLKTVIDDNMFGRRSTALKRAITIVDKEPELGVWREWVHNAVRDAGIVMQLSREQLLAYLRISGDVPSALNQTIDSFTDQPFTQPKAIFLRVLEKLATQESSEVRDLCARGVQRLKDLNDPVLNVALKHFSN